MKPTSMLFAAAAALFLLPMSGALDTASAAPAAAPHAAISKIAKSDAVEQVRYRGGPRRRIVRGAYKFKPLKWCKNHPYRCSRGIRSWRWCKNHPARCHGRGRGYGVGYGHRGWLCHRHLYPVPGMFFHPRARCNHRHFRAYRSWEWVN